MGSKKLESNGAFELRVLGLIDNPQPALAELLGDAAMRDGLADHGLPLAEEIVPLRRLMVRTTERANNPNLLRPGR